MNKRNITGFLAAILFGGILAAFADETLTITTYYPSPQGVYKKLRLYPSTAGSVGACNLANEGFMYYDNSTHSVNVCTNSSGTFGYQPVPGSGGFWDLNGADLNVTNSSWNVSARNFVGTAVPTDSGQFRAVSSTYGTMLRQDGANFYILHTNASDPYGGWSEHRPFIANNSDGNVFLANGYSGGGGNVYLVSNNTAGRVAIGAIGPQYKVDVFTNSSLDGIRLFDGSRSLRLFSGTLLSGQYNALVQNRDSAMIFTNGTVGTGGMVIAPHTGGGVRSGLRMNNDGDVEIAGRLGIGTTTPQHVIETVGVLHFGATSTNSAGPILIIGNDAVIHDIDTASTIGLTNLAGTDWATWKAHLSDPSSRTYKKGIVLVDKSERNALLAQLRGLELKRFHYNSDNERVTKHLGVIAEESPAVILSRDESKGISMADYVSLGILGVQSSLDEIDQLKKENELLRDRLDKLEGKIGKE